MNSVLKAWLLLPVLVGGLFAQAPVDDPIDALPMVELQARPGTRPFNLRGDARMIFETVLAAFGITAEFEADYQSPPAFRYQTGEMNFTEAVRGLEAAANSMVVPLTPTSALIVRDTPQRRTDTVPVVAASILIPERMAVQEAQEIMQAAQQTLELRHISLDQNKRVVVVRDIASKVQAARALFSDLSRLRAQVSIEVEFISVDKNSSLSMGLSLPTSSAIVDFGNVLRNAPKAAANMVAFGGGQSLVALGIGDATALATLTKGSSTQSVKSQVLTIDGQAASLHNGDRYPIITSGYYGNTSGTNQTYRPPPTVNFEDLGLVMKLTPTVHTDGEISIEIDAAFKVLAGTSVNDIPIVSSRKFQGKVRLGAGQWAVVAGLDQSIDSTSSSRLGIPGLGRLFGSRTRRRSTGETLILIKPRLTNLPPWEYPVHTVWYGTESHPLSTF